MPPKRPRLEGNVHYTASESEDGGGRDMRHHLQAVRRVRKPRESRALGQSGDANSRHLANIPRLLLESIVKLDEGSKASAASSKPAKGGWSIRYNDSVNGLLVEARKPQFKPETILSTWPKLQVSHETQEYLEEYREKLPGVDAAVAVPLVLSLLQVRRMQREMDVLSRQVKLLQKRFGKDVVESARKDAERLRDQDELSYLGGPIRIKTNYAPKEDKLRDMKVTCTRRAPAAHAAVGAQLP